MSNVSLITKLGLIVTTAGALSIGVRYSSQYGDISAGIAELKNRGLAYMQMYNTNAGKLKELQGVYEGILAKLGLEKGADLETITNKIDSITNAEQLKEIATALGLEPTADVTAITNKIEELNTKVKNLQTEIANAKADLEQANEEQGKLLGEIETALEAVPAMATQEPGENETPEQEPGNSEEPGDGEETGGGEEAGDGEETGGENEELANLKATMDTAWQAVEVKLTSKVTSDDREQIKAGNYTIDGMNSLRVNGINRGTVSADLDNLIKAYLTAKEAYINAGGEL